MVLSGIKNIGISDPLRGIAKMAKNFQFIAADDMLTNKDKDLHSRLASLVHLYYNAHNIPHDAFEVGVHLSTPSSKFYGFFLYVDILSFLSLCTYSIK